MTPKKIGPDDSPTLATLEALCQAHPWSESAIRSTLLSPSGVGWLTESGWQPAAYLIGSFAGETAEVLSIGVAPPARRLGLARTLLSHAENHWTGQGVQTLWLEVHEKNTRAIQLYESSGWHETGRRPRYYRDGGAAILMSKLLNSH